MNFKKRKALNLVLATSLFILFSSSCVKDINQLSVNEVALPTLSNSQVNEASYLGKNFYLKSTDSDGAIENPVTRSGGGDRMLSRSFEVISLKDGPQYIGVHLMAAFTDDNGTLQKVDVLVNDEYVGVLDVHKAEWDFVTMKDNKPVQMSKGTNTITFLSEPPFYPEIDAVQIEADLLDLVMSDPQYEDFITQISKSNSFTNDKLEQAGVESLIEEERMLSIKTRSAYDDSYDWQVTGRTLENPDGNYNHKVCVPVTYTYHRKLSLTAGTYTFWTGPVDGDDYYSVDPVMYLYKIDDPHNYSYYSDDISGRGRHSEISATVPAGDYYLLIRAYSSSYASSETGRQGLVNVYQNGSLLNSSCPVAGYVVDVDSPNTGTLNYFTAYSTGLPQFFLEEKSSHKAKFFGDMYFYVAPMEQMWYDDARLRLNKPSSTDRYRMIITCVGALGAYYGNCDVYGSCQQVMSSDGILSVFPNLKANDGIYSSASRNVVYNCAAWAGGITTGWMWNGLRSTSGTLVGTDYGEPTVWTTWDNYFGNNPQRYAGATTYTREGATASNSEVAVWSYNGDISGVTHFSCTGTANNHPHGYAWESKPGQERRIFHPRDALSGDVYGSIMAYYRDASKSITPYNLTRSNTYNDLNSISFEESIKQGLTVIEEVNLSPEHLKLFSNTNAQTRAGVLFDTSEVSNLYSKWKEAVNNNSFFSNPYTYIELPEGQALHAYCVENKIDALAFFVNLYFIDSSNDAAKAISHYMFCSIFAEYADIIETIKDKWRADQYNDDGAYIAPLPETFLKKFAKELISEFI